MNSNFKMYLNEKTTLIESYLNHIFSEMDINPMLQEAMMYSLQAGGKRLRPVLSLLACEALGEEGTKAISAACAVELIHTYSLIHDDLPAMDNDDYRRGKLTNHKVYGQAMAILAGDALLTHAFYVLTSLSFKNGLPASVISRLVQELSLYAGPAGMVGGQAYDLQGEQETASLETLERIHKHKTGDLIVFSLRSGGICGGADERQLDALTEFGYRIGLAFQVQDDILDLIGDEQKLGKRTQSDAKLQKVTYPHLIGLEASKELVEQLTSSGKKILSNGNIPAPEKLLALADYLVSRDH